jgi:hypothetical protein
MRYKLSDGGQPSDRCCRTRPAACRGYALMSPRPSHDPIKVERIMGSLFLLRLGLVSHQLWAETEPQVGSDQSLSFPRTNSAISFTTFSSMPA